MTMLRDATLADLPALLALMPRLADFDLPPARSREELWRGDAELLSAHLRGEVADRLARVAVSGDGALLGLTLVSLRPEALSGEASAHLEVILVAPSAEGTGLGRRLLTDAEQQAASHGARSMTLHVFARNTRARRLYEAAQYDGELLRYLKRLG